VKSKALALAAAGVALYALPALAHHSFAMFDGTKRLTLQGTVKDFQWTFPHCWIVLMVPDAAGKPAIWPIEMMPPVTLGRQGWLPKTLTAGMKVTVVIHPLKENRMGGQFMSVTLPGGKKLSIGGYHEG
jgi:hypothetical protein